MTYSCCIQANVYIILLDFCNKRTDQTVQNILTVGVSMSRKNDVCITYQFKQERPPLSSSVVDKTIVDKYVFADVDIAVVFPKFSLELGERLTKFDLRGQTLHY